MKLWYIVNHKNVTLYFCPYLCQLLTDIQSLSTDTLCRQFAIMWLLYIPIFHYTVNVSLHYLVKYKCKKKLTIITNILYGLFTEMLVWRVFFIYQNVCLLLSLRPKYLYFIYTLQGNVKHFYGMVGYIITTLLQLSAECQWKNCGNRSIIDEDIDKSKVPLFPTLYYRLIVSQKNLN